MTTIISKILLHLMASMTRVDKSIQICKRNLLDENDDQSTILPLYTRLELFSNERLQWIWLLYFVLISPDILLFFRSIHSCLFKNYSFPDFGATLTIIMASSFEVIGISLLIFIVLPSFDSIVGLMITNSLFLLPSFLHLIRIFSDNNNSNRNEHGCSNRIMKIAYSLAFLFQIISIIAWPILILLNNQKYESQTIDDNLFDPKHDDVNLCWIIPLSCILITIGYWENFLDDIDGNELSKKNQFIQSFYKIKHSSLRSKFAIYLFVSIWKCILHLIMMLLIQGTLSVYYDKSKINENNVDVKNDWKGMNSMIKFMFTNFSDAFKQHSITLITESKYAEHIPTIDSNPMSPVWIALIQIFSSFLCYQTINFVCKICIQPIGFALPITIAMPVTVSLAHLLGQIAMNDRCILSDYWHLFDYTFLNVPYDIFAYKYWVNYLFWIIWMLAFISQTIITNYIWISSKERLRSTGKLFMIPLYTTAFIDQSLMLNRCCNNDNNIRSSDENKNHQTSKLMNKQVNNKNDDKNDIHIIACATIWHETADELLQMLKSIMRVDKDQCCRLAATRLNVAKSDVDFYHFETHLFVDDAFKKGKYFDKNENDIDINVYVETMISVLDEAAQNVHQCLVKIRPPEIYLTPFGGRIEWQLPGRTKLIAHLKDKSRIRHRKRWSQVMYMYYLLGYRIYQQDPDRKDDLMENTFLLALDGDINFQPEAILLLVDLMKKNPKLGAACGRVHPIGNGPMAWYQKFEYAISHWLQKATEHVFGCVLCSPGCFSLFRASALADDNVMNRYTTKPTEARHYVQYDQGEDRWLCTLLLQQGWKVEYSAASDSFTHCPEGFDDFYVQRRRWMPSTMANIIDLLKSYKNTVRINENISSLYILYQAGLMLGAILTPGTILLMLVGAVNNSFGLKHEISFYINTIPVVIFIIVCFFTENKTQILVAQLFSVFYMMLMLAVLVSTFIQIYNDSIFSPSVIFFVGMILVFIIAAMIHPQEFSCLFPLFIYMLMIPSMYLLLTLYSIINLNVVSWGTRENPQQAEKEKAKEKSKSNPNDDFFDDVRHYFQKQTKKLEIFNCVCCGSTSRNNDEISLLHDIRNSMQQVQSNMNRMKSQSLAGNELIRRMSVWNRRQSLVLNQATEQSENEPLLESDEFINNNNTESDIIKNHDKDKIPEEILNLRRPKWIHNKYLEKKSLVQTIDDDEYQFWTLFIEKYLKPLDENTEHQRKIKADLIDLRNRAFFAMGILNLVYVLFVYLMQLHKDIFSFDVIISSIENGTKTMLIDDEEREIPVYIHKKIQMDPVGIILIIFFGLIIILQLIGMFLHRMETLTHLLAFTDLNFFRINSKDEETNKYERLFDRNSLQLIRSLIEKPVINDNGDKYFDIIEYLTPIIRKLMNRNFAQEIAENAISNKKLGKELQRRSSMYIVGNSTFLPKFNVTNGPNNNNTDNDDNTNSDQDDDDQLDTLIEIDSSDEIFSGGSSSIQNNGSTSYNDNRNDYDDDNDHEQTTYL